MAVHIWKGGEHDFALRIGELKALQDATEGGLGQVLSRLFETARSPMLGTWLIADLMETTRLGLIGGGMDKVEAQKMVSQCVDSHGITSLIPIAISVLMEALQSRDEEDTGGAEGEVPPPINGTSDKS